MCTDWTSCFDTCFENALVSKLLRYITRKGLAQGSSSGTPPMWSAHLMSQHMTISIRPSLSILRKEKGDMPGLAIHLLEVVKAWEQRYSNYHCLWVGCMIYGHLELSEQELGKLLMAHIRSQHQCWELFILTVTDHCNGKLLYSQLSLNGRSE